MLRTFFYKNRRDFSKGQVTVEFAFCMIVLLLMIYGTMRVFRWAGQDLNTRSYKHYKVLRKDVTQDYGAGQCAYWCHEENGERQKKDECHCAKSCPLDRSGNTYLCYAVDQDCGDCKLDNVEPDRKACDDLKCPDEWNKISKPCICRYGSKSEDGDYKGSDGAMYVVTSTTRSVTGSCPESTTRYKLIPNDKACEEQCICGLSGRYGTIRWDSVKADGNCEEAFYKYCGICDEYEYDCSGEGILGREGPLKQIYPDFYEPERLKAIWKGKYLFK